MANTHAGIAYSWDLPEFVGELYTADIVPGAQEVNPSFLTLIGGLNGGSARLVPDMNFNMTVEFDYPDAIQPSISEQESVAGLPGIINPLLTPTDNTCQIFQEAVEESYMSMSTRGRLVTDQVYRGADAKDDQGWMSEFSPANDASGLDKQVAYALQRIARNVNYTFLNGTYVKSTGKGVAPKTRGILEAVTTNAVAAAGAALSDDLLSLLMEKMVTNSSGMAFQSIPVLIMGAQQKKLFSQLYAFPPESRNVAGYNIKQFETDFGTVGVLYEPTIPADTILFASMSMIRPVYNAVPGKGIVFYEPKSKIAASAGGMLYGHIGLDYGPEWMHGKITGLKVRA